MPSAIEIQVVPYTVLAVGSGTLTNGAPLVIAVPATTVGSGAVAIGAFSTNTGSIWLTKSGGASGGGPELTPGRAITLKLNHQADPPYVATNGLVGNQSYWWAVLA